MAARAPGQSGRAVVALALAACHAGAPAAVTSAITAGDPDAGDAEVVALVARGVAYCSGTLIAPALVLSAAHCLDAAPPDAVAFGAEARGGTMVSVRLARAHPDYDPVTLAHDLALVLLAGAAPAAATPARLRARPLDAASVGATLRLVGFGGGAKRSGSARLAAVTAASLDLAAAPAQICNGDSGGPVFLAGDDGEELAGVASFGSVDCRQSGTAARVDGDAGWVSAFVAATAPGEGAPGSRCYDDARCARGGCFFPEDAPGFGYCSPTCTVDADCPSALACRDDGGARRCQYRRPSPGALGGACTRADGCASGVCAATVDGTLVCTQQCFPDAAACPRGQRCVAADERPGLYICEATPRAAGCSYGGRGDGVSDLAGGIAALALVLAALAARAGRRRHRA